MMPRYYVECHEDGEILPTHSSIVEANTLVRAGGLGLLNMLDARGRIDVDKDGFDTDAAIEAAEDTCYVDVCVELPVHFTGEPARALDDAVSELLGNRDHLDLHEDDRRMLEQALEVQQAVRKQRESAGGGLY